MIRHEYVDVYDNGEIPLCRFCESNVVESWMKEQGSLDRVSFVARCVNGHYFQFVVILFSEMAERKPK